MPLIHFAPVSSPTNVFARPARKHTAAALLVSVLVFPTAQGQELAITSPKAREVMDQCIARFKKALDEKLAATQDPARIERLHKSFEGAIHVCHEQGKIIQDTENKKASIAAKEASIAAKEGSIATKEASIATKEASIAAKEASIAALKQDTENKKANIERLRAERAESQKAIAESKERIADNNNEMAKMEEAERVHTAFIAAGLEYVRLVREGGTPAQIEAARAKTKALQEQVIQFFRDIKDPRFNKRLVESTSAIKF